MSPFEPRYYRLAGRIPVPCHDLLEWARWFQKNRRLFETHVGCLRVSTIFLGLDHSFDDGPPLLFETMIFGDTEDSYQDRCSTWNEAEAMHAKAVALAEEMVRKADAILNPS